jgi:thiamine pyrophosphate-dependent acetolactate synthase large subunit-like protein
MMGEERFAVAVADGVLAGHLRQADRRLHVMANLNAAGIQMAYGAIGQAWEDSSPILVIAEGVGQGASRHTHFDMAEALQVGHQVGRQGRPRRAHPRLRARARSRICGRGAPGPVLLIVPRDLGEYDTDEHPYSPVKGWRSGPDPDDVKSAVKALLAAKDPLLYVGEGVYYADATAELLKFAELAQVPVLTTLKARAPSRRTTRSRWACAARWPITSSPRRPPASRSARASSPTGSATRFRARTRRRSSSALSTSSTSTGATRRATRWSATRS